MADLLTEQEQVDLIKQSFKKYGHWVLLLIALVFLGLTAFNWFQNKSAERHAQAMLAYEQMLGYVQLQRLDDLSALVHHAMDTEPTSIYTSLGVLLLAGQQISAQQTDAAISSLQWVVTHCSDVATQQIAELRLARIWIAQRKPQEALKTLASVKLDPIADILRGDAQVELHQWSNAQGSYEDALSKLDSQDPWHSVVSFKLAQLNGRPQ